MDARVTVSMFRFDIVASFDVLSDYLLVGKSSPVSVWKCPLLSLRSATDEYVDYSQVKNLWLVGCAIVAVKCFYKLCNVR